MQLNNNTPVNFLSVVRKNFDKLKTIGFLIALVTVVFFFWFPLQFWVSRSTVEILTFAVDRITRAFNIPGTTRAVALNI